MSSQGDRNGWSLEVAKGQEIGKRYAMAGSDLILGTALDGASGINLSSQEESGGGSRKMTGRHAQLERDPQGAWRIRDLESASGTFVNRQRLLSGQTRSLRPGDVIQLGAVHLKVVATPIPVATLTESAPVPNPLAASIPVGGSLRFAMPSGIVCRSWDDFLKVSSQRWGELREELVSGRLAGHLTAIGRADLAPDPNEPGSPDERLDQWLAKLPAAFPAGPELEVHPETITVKFAPGGWLQRKLRVSNVGYRLLRCSPIRIEPSSAASWARTPPPWSSEPFVAIDEAEIPIEIAMPETGGPPLPASVVIQSNGGSKRVPIVWEQAKGASGLDFRLDSDGAPDPKADTVSVAAEWTASLAAVPAPRRVLVGAFWLLTLRAGAEQANRALTGSGWGANALEAPFPLLGPLLMMTILGGCAGAVIAWRRGQPSDFPPMALAGSIAGLPAAALLTALVRSIEYSANPAGIAFSMACALWLFLGGLLGWLAAFIGPARADLEPK